MTKTLTKAEIKKALKVDNDSNMFGWIGEFSETKSDNNNLGGFITAKMVQKLEAEGVIGYIQEENFWANRAEYEKIVS